MSASERPDLPVAAPDPAAVIRAAFEHAWFQRNTSSDGQVGPNAREASNALDAFLAERQQDKQRIERLEEALSWYADRRNYRPSAGDFPDIPRGGYAEVTDSFDKKGAGARARAALAVEEDARPTQHVTHGRHCTCSACAREDWTRITGPCGMHGSSCPAVYAPLGGAGDDVPLAAVEEDAPAGKPETPGNSGAAVEEDAE